MGVDIVDSVYSSLKAMWINTEPLIVHRLDMGTSGLLVVAKKSGAHKHIQNSSLPGLSASGTLHCFPK